MSLGLNTRRFSCKSCISMILYYKGYWEERPENTCLSKRMMVMLCPWQVWGLSVEWRSCQDVWRQRCILVYNTCCLEQRKLSPFKLAGERRVSGPLSKERNGLRSPHLGDRANIFTKVGTWQGEVQWGAAYRISLEFHNLYWISWGIKEIPSCPPKEEGLKQQEFTVFGYNYF